MEFLKKYKINKINQKTLFKPWTEAHGQNSNKSTPCFVWCFVVEKTYVMNLGAKLE